MDRPSAFLLGGTNRWTIITVDANGAAVDADSPPGVTVRKNGSLVGDSVTVTKRASTTGIYDCSHDPSAEAEGDQFEYLESATIGGIPYPNSWTARVAAVERGTDGAALAADWTAARAGYVDNLNGHTPQTGDTFAQLPTNFSFLAILGTGQVGINWNNIANKTAAVNLAATTLNRVNTNDDMRGTDGAALAAQWTATRAAYIDNLSAGPAATQASVDTLTNAVRNQLVIPTEYQLPAAGAERFKLTVLTYDATGNLNDPDANTITVAVENSAGTDRSGNLFDDPAAGSATTTMTRIGVGQYVLWYEVDSGDAVEQLNWLVSYDEGSAPMLGAGQTTLVAISSGGGFNSSDRTMLTNVNNDLADGGRIDVILDATLADTNELQQDDVPGLIAALHNVSQTDITGGAYPLSTDANGRVRHVVGTGVGELGTALGGVSLQPNAINVNTVSNGALSQAKFGAAFIQESSFINGAISASKIAAGALNGKGDWATSANTTAILNRIGAVNSLGSGATLFANLADIAGSGFASAEDSLKVVQDLLSVVTGLIENVSGNRFTAKALEQAPVGGGGGSLSGPHTVTITVDDGTVPIEGASVRMHRAGETETKPTDVDGQVTFTVEPATWSVSISASGFVGQTNSLVVSADAAPTYTLVASVLTPPDEPGLCNVHVYVKQNGVAVENAEVRARIKNKNSATDGVVLSLKDIRVQTDADGLAILPLVQQGQFVDGDGVYVIEVIDRRVESWKIEAAIPDQLTAILEDLISP